MKPNGQFTVNRPHFYIYMIVVNCDAGQFPVGQMITERHTTTEIGHWLREWHQSVGIPPNEVVTDSSRALQTAVVQTFSNFKVLEEYVNGCFDSDSMPACWLRTDVAHFIHKYTAFLKNYPPRIKTFFAASIGKLLRSTSLEESKLLLERILTVCLCETCGHLVNIAPPVLSECQKAINYLKQLIVTGKTLSLS